MSGVPAVRGLSPSPHRALTAARKAFGVLPRDPPGDPPVPVGTVAYLTKRFPRLSETFVLDEILALEAAGVPLRLYAVAPAGESLEQPDVSRVKSPVVYLRGTGGRLQSVVELARTVSAHGVLMRRSPRRYAAVVAYVARKRRHLSTVRRFAEAGRLAVLIERDGATHLHAAFAHGPASTAHFVHLLTGVPFSFGGHAKDIYVSAPDLLARKIAAASFVLACSESAAGALREIGGPAAGKVVLARHGVDTRRFAPVEPSETSLPGGGVRGPLRVLAVGRLVEKKGYPVLLGALAEMVRRGRLVSCEIVGSGPGRKALEEQAEALGLAAVVRFVGPRTHQQIAAAYRQADVFVQASVVVAGGDRDGIPNALLEAMASGLAVVASEVAGIPEVVTPGCGVLVPAGDPAALAAAICRLDDDSERRARLGSAARRRVVACFDRVDCARSTAQLFAERARMAGSESPRSESSFPRVIPTGRIHR